MKKGIVFHVLICFVVLAVCVRPLQLNAQSGSSTCQVTATAGETESPPPGDAGAGKDEPEKPGATGGPETEPTEGTGDPEAGPSKEPGEPGKGEAAPEEDGTGPEPGETETPAKPEGGKMPGTEGDTESAGGPEKETPEPEGTSIPGEGTAYPDAGGDTPEEKEPVQTGELVPGEQPEEYEGYDRIIRWLLSGLLILGIFAALLAGGAFRWLWRLLCFLVFRRSRIRFHGILTDKKNFFIRVENAEEGSGLVQDMIDSAGSLAELKKKVLKETAATCIPGQSRMRISCSGQKGRKRVRETAASEPGLFRILENLEGAGEVEVRITCQGTGIDIPLVFRV